MDLGKPKTSNNGLKYLPKQPTLKSNVTFKYKELEDATGGFNKENLIGVGGFAKVRRFSDPSSFFLFLFSF